MTSIEAGGLALLLALYSIGSLTALFCLSFANRLARTTAWFTTAGLATHLGLIVLRMARTGHLPVVGEYENALSFSAVAVATGFIFARRRPERLLPVLAVILPVSVLMIGFAAFREPDPMAMTAPYRSPWLYVHVLFYLGAFAAAAVAAGASAVAIARRAKPPDRNLVIGGLRFGFACHGIGIIAGAIWAHYLWGTYWNWDPIESWGLAAWLLTGTILHLERAGWLRGIAPAWGAVVSFLFLFYSIFGISLLEETFHGLNRI